MELLLTDVTYMSGGKVCVAGWCAEKQCMVRPLSGPAQHWSSQLARSDLFQVGNRIHIVPSATESVRGLPHVREDVVVSGTPAFLGSVSDDALAVALRPNVSPSVDALFRNQVEEGKYVPEGAECPSLGCIVTGARQLGFVPVRDGAKLRCWFYDGSDARYNLPVSSKLLQDAFHSGGLEALSSLAEGRRKALIRLGLAHPYDDNAKCFIMVNHVLFHG